MPEAVRKTITERLLRNASSERFRGFTLLSALAFATLAAPGARAADKAAELGVRAAAAFRMGRLLCRRPFGLRRRALELVGSGHRGVWQHREAYRHIHRGGQLHRRIPGRLQSSAAVPCAPGGRGGLHLPRLSRPFGSIHGRDGQFHFAVARARDLYGSDAGLRDGARPPRLCVQRLAALCHGRLRLDPRPADPDANLERNDGRSFPVAVRAGPSAPASRFR